VSDPKNLTINVPNKTIVSARWRSRRRTPILSPNDGQTYANPTDGQAYSSITLTDSHNFPLSWPA
jgi:hypothetical protein